jgi:hypothetical protein
MSTTIFALEQNGFPVKIEEGSTSAYIFGQDVSSALSKTFESKRDGKNRPIATALRPSTSMSGVET